LTILFGITGSIAAYKSLNTIRLLVKAGHSVTPILTQACLRFITPWSVEALAHRTPVIPNGDYANHIDLSGDCLVIAPATANSIAKYANGIADDPLSTLALSFTGPKLIAPAMHDSMFRHPATQRNLAQLRADGWLVLGPDTGDLSGMDHGEGRLVESELVALAAQQVAQAPITQRPEDHIVITAGGTQVPIDAVRVISNRSSGRWGEMMAHVASLSGARVTLITSQPVRIQNPQVCVIHGDTVESLQAALTDTVASATHLYMMAAVSDFSVPMSPSKRSRANTDALPLTPTPDILANLSTPDHTIRVGFCLETDNLEATASQKRIKKSCDYMVANDATTIGQTHRSFLILSPTKTTQYTNLPLETAAQHVLAATQHPPTKTLAQP